MYCQTGITYKIKHYIERMPIVCKKLRCKIFIILYCDMIYNALIVLDADEKSKLPDVLMETVKALMLDEYEILHWANHIDRFDFIPQ